METTERLEEPTAADPQAGDRYLLLADISGYTGFMSGVEQVHSVDFSGGIPVGYAVLGGLLDAITIGVAPHFALVKLEGDAVFGVAPAPSLDGHGDQVLATLAATYASFVDARTAAIPSRDHVCTACPAVAHLDLKMILHRGFAVRQTVGSGTELLGPAVNVAHRLLKNTVRTQVGDRPYLFMSDAAAGALGLGGIGIGHVEEYADAGHIEGRIVELA